MLPSDIIKNYRVRKGNKFRLADFDPGDTDGESIGAEEAEALLAAGVKRLAALQERLFAEHRWAILIILQGLDAAGKDSVIKHVMSGVNPQGCEVHSFKAPSPQELDHDYLWRASILLPGRGHIGIFNRSYYEEVLVVRVHPELLKQERLPPALITENIWTERFEDIASFERYLGRNGIVPLKFFLHVSQKEQLRRLLRRLQDPARQWKFSLSDVRELHLWDDYMRSYEDMIRHTSTPETPWYVIPADHKWFTRLVVAATIVEQLEKLNPQFPKLDEEALRDLEKIRKALLEQASILEKRKP